jgi:hypothetical protein
MPLQLGPAEAARRMPLVEGDGNEEDWRVQGGLKTSTEEVQAAWSARVVG